MEGTVRVLHGRCNERLHGQGVYEFMQDQSLAGIQLIMYFIYDDDDDVLGHVIISDGHNKHITITVVKSNTPVDRAIVG